MSRKSKRRYARLSAEDRMVIQACILKRMTATQIAARIGFDKSTVSRELRSNATRKPGRAIPCPKRFLGLCNGCGTAAYCHREKAYYDFAEADARSMANRSAPRSSPNTTR